MKRKRNDNYFGYHFFSTILKIAGKVWFGGKVEGRENIPKDGGCILAGNHLGGCDCYLLFLATNRPVHMIAKKELFDSPLSWFFKAMHLVPVDRNHKNPEAKKEAIKILNEGKVLGIFPEGTYHKKDLLLPFKPGAISFAEKTGMPIIPFAMDFSYKFRCNPKIRFGKPINVSELKCDDKVKFLEDIVRDMLIDMQNKKR